jgi:2',3'-cyclic-nucleotide 2'-phosphodiesterase / 3'-nucleotidase
MKFDRFLCRRSFTLCVLIFGLVVSPALSAFSFTGNAQAAVRTHIVILSTTDLHGNIYPIDYNTNAEDSRGLARLSTVIKQLRKQDPDLILTDSGDTIQGTPLTYYHARKNNNPRDPMALVMSAIGYDAMAVGNHEYEFGFDVLDKARKESSFPWLSANTYKKGTDETFFQPYLVKKVRDIRIGILGLTTTGMPNLDDPDHYYSKIEIRNPTDEARKWVTVLREKEQADLVVIVMHMGLEEDLETGETLPGQMTGENAAAAIARRVPGVDAILMGHTHREWPSLYINGVLLVQANKWAKSLARVDLYLEKNQAGEGWRVIAKSARAILVDEKVQPDPEILRLAQEYHQQTQSWLDQVVANSPVELRAGDERFRDTPLLDLVHRVQLEAGSADVSLASSLNSNARIPKGPVTVRDLVALYEYERVLVVIEVTGRQLKDALEYSANYFRAYTPGKSASDLIDERFPSYNFEIAEGVAYTLDISKPIGQRIRDLSFRGQPLRADQKLRLATNNYRTSGGAGYTMLKGAPVVYRSRADLRELIIDWVKRKGVIPTTATDNWKLLP